MDDDSGKKARDREDFWESVDPKLLKLIKDGDPNAPDSSFHVTDEQHDAYFKNFGRCNEVRSIPDTTMSEADPVTDRSGPERRIGPKHPSHPGVNTKGGGRGVE